jgi:hypothetical protein
MDTGIRGAASDIMEFISCEARYLMNRYTVGAALVAVAGVVSGVAIVYFLGVAGAGFAVIASVLLIGVGSSWLIKRGRHIEQGRVLAAHIDALKNAIPNIQKFDIDDDAFKKANTIYNAMKKYKKSHEEIVDFLGYTNSYLIDKSSENMLKANFSEMITAFNGSDFIHETYKTLAEREWAKIKQ